MRNFYKMASGMDVMPLMVALHSKPHLWNQNTLRTTAKVEVENVNGGKEVIETPHREIDDIWLRMNDLSKCYQSDAEKEAFFDHRECINYPALLELPQAKALIMALMVLFIPSMDISFIN